AKEHVKEVEPTIFFMDIRAYGKDFDKFYDRAKDIGVRFIRARVGKIEEIKESSNLLVYYINENRKLEIEEFDLVVLSIGFRPTEDIIELSDTLDVRLNPYNFIESMGFSPIETTRPGVFICGPAVSPKDIPETVMQSSGAVAEAAELLADVRGTEIIEKIYPPERDVIGEKPRIGVFVCYCGINIGSVVDVPAVVEYAKTLPNVIYTESNLFTCSQDTQQIIKEKIEEHNLNRVVVASCSPTTHEPLFQETLREAGLNPYLFEMANIRNQCSWVHKDEPVKATEKAKTLVKIAVGKARLLEPLFTVTLDVTQKGLVIGGGFAGMISALSIAEQGFEVALIEREKNLGGNLKKLYYTQEGNDVQEYLKNLIYQVENNPQIKVYKNSKIKEIQGYIGNYKTIIKSNDSNSPTPRPQYIGDKIGSGEEAEYEHGIIVIATGANESKPDEYLYEENENVITQLELEKYLVTQKEKYKKLKNIVMIQCVGSRNDEHPYCSRVCCTQAIKNAIRLKELNPKMNIFILYRDIRTYGFLEMYYQQARDKGVIFIRYEEDEKPVVCQRKDKNSLIVEIDDRIIGNKLVIEPNLIVLAPAMVPQEDAYNLSQMLKIPLNEDNFFMEAHVKLRPVDFAVEGIFLAGLAHSPKGIDETISQAKAAAERACTIISSDKYTAEANIATVDEEVCAGCGICVSVCPYNASELIFKNGRRVCQINTALCKGCGSCACVCPSGAMQQYGFKETQTLEMVYEAL
ncbi:MAG: FAD-dependent oxidoreductase, partial [Candidatus Cloacimonetes bacterium]|nr:FAD-dependent oxidoreductase [Candidatus Cloacimonadota bacterium]